MRDECQNELCKAGCYPSYGVAPHGHDMTKTGNIFGSTVIEPEEKWPPYFKEDPEAPGCGTYVCPDCGR